MYLRLPFYSPHSKSGFPIGKTSTMFDDHSSYFLRRLVLDIQRSSLHTAYCFSWNEKTKRAIPLRNKPQYWLFQTICLSITFAFLPISTWQSYQAFTMEATKKPDRLACVLAYAFTLSIWSFVPYTWVFMRYSGTTKYIHVFEATQKLEQRFTGKYIIIHK